MAYQGGPFFAQALVRMFGTSGQGRPALSPELVSQIYDYIVPNRSNSASPSLTQSSRAAVSYTHPALRPPRNGVCKFMELPTEVRKAIFASELAGRDVEYQPRCLDHPQTARSTNDHAEADDIRPLPKRNRMSDLMTINKAVCREITLVMYEERSFRIHVHEGIKRGGVEFLNSGCQKLQYQDDIIVDTRFEKFKHGEEFGFERLKKIKITIFPPFPVEATYRHVQLNTFFMHQALCQLLQRSEPNNQNKITKLEIDFAPLIVRREGLTGRRAIAASEGYLWDSLSHKPLATSIEGITNIEVILRPFSILRCHNVEITLPPKLCDHGPTKAFVAKLKERMLSPLDQMIEEGADLMDDYSAAQIRSLGPDLQRYVFDALYGTGKGIEVPDLGHGELWEDKEDAATKHCLSPITKKYGGDEKRRKSDELEDDSMDEENWRVSQKARLHKYRERSEDAKMKEMESSDDEDLQHALLASMSPDASPPHCGGLRRSIRKQEELMKRALHASLPPRAPEPGYGGVNARSVDHAALGHFATQRSDGRRHRILTGGREIEADAKVDQGNDGDETWRVAGRITVRAQLQSQAACEGDSSQKASRASEGNTTGDIAGDQEIGTPSLQAAQSSDVATAKENFGIAASQEPVPHREDTASARTAGDGVIERSSIQRIPWERSERRWSLLERQRREGLE